MPPPSAQPSSSHGHSPQVYACHQLPRYSQYKPSRRDLARRRPYVVHGRHSLMGRAPRKRHPPAPAHPSECHYGRPRRKCGAQIRLRSRQAQGVPRAGAHVCDTWVPRDQRAHPVLFPVPPPSCIFSTRANMANRYSRERRSCGGECA